MSAQPAFFETHAIRRVYDEETEIWWFSVVDIVQVLTQQPDYQTARKYWNKLKERLGKEGSQLVTHCHQLKMLAADGKQRPTDAATAETLLRLIQSVPSPNAEPIKLWLAKVGYERMQEMADPALSLDRARETWQKHGRSEKWIRQRMTGQETRNKPTDYWANHDIKQGEEFAILTNLIHQEWSGVSVKAHKAKKGLKDHNLRDHMSEAELIFTALAELSTRQIAETDEASGMPENSAAAKIRWRHCQAGAQGAGSEDRQAGGNRRQFSAADPNRSAQGAESCREEKMNEAETRAEHIDPALAAAGWGVVEGSRIRREYPITPGRIEGHGRQGAHGGLRVEEVAVAPILFCRAVTNRSQRAEAQLARI